MQTNNQVLIIGAGFGGMAAARELSGCANIDVTIIDCNNHHTFQPLLYQVATAGLEGEQVARSVRDYFIDVSNVSFRLGRVTDLQPVQQTVETADGSRLYYDELILAAGARTAYFDVPGAEENSFALKNIGDALRIRSHILEQFERADQDSSTPASDRRTVVVGGGPTGVELSGALVELYDEVLRSDYPDLSFDIDITLVEQRPHVLHRYPEDLREHAREKLRSYGVDLRLDHHVDHVDEGHLHFTDEPSLEYGTLIWSAGIRTASVADTVARRLDADQASGGRIYTDDRLRIDGRHEGSGRCFAIGDIAAIKQGDQLLPQRAPAAQQAGQYVARQIKKRMDGSFVHPFRHQPKGQMAVVGRGEAVAQIARPELNLTGLPAWALWAGVHLAELTGMRNRLMVAIEWLDNVLTHSRNARIIVPPDRRGLGPDDGA